MRRDLPERFSRKVVCVCNWGADRAAGADPADRLMAVALVRWRPHRLVLRGRSGWLWRRMTPGMSRNCPDGRNWPSAPLIFHLLLIQPNHPAAMTWGALFVFPLELPVILAGLVALPPGRWSRLAARRLVAALMLIATLKTADFACSRRLAAASTRSPTCR
jgi:hypothetical protein